MRTEAAVALLQRTKLFAELGEPILRALADHAVERSYPAARPPLPPGRSRPGCS